MGGDIDQRAFEPFGVGMAELERGEFLQMVVQQPRMIERGLQDQRLAPRHRRAMAAMHRARGQLLARPPHRASTRPRLAARPGAASRALPRRASFRPSAARASCRARASRAAALRRREETATAGAEILPVISAHRFVADAAVTSLMRASSAARRSGVSKGGLRSRAPTACRRAAAPRRSHRRPPRARPSAPDRPGPAPPAAARIQALARLEPRQRQIDRAVGGAPAGAVAVEAEHRLVRHLPEQRQLIFGQRRAERRDRCRKARRDHGDDVDIAFDRRSIGAPSCAAWRAAAML